MAWPGGRPGTPSRNVLNPGTENRELPAKCTLTVRHGDVYRHELAGAGGWGDPFERDPERVLRDVMEEKISRGVRAAGVRRGHRRAHVEGRAGGDGAASRGGAGRALAPRPEQASMKTPQGDQPEEHLQPDPGRKRRAPVPREDREDGLVDAEA